MLKLLYFFLSIFISFTSQQSAQAKDTLVLDLDNVFLHHRSDQELPDIFHFLSHSSFIPTDHNAHTYIAPAYIKEFFKFANHKYHIIFFSSGIAERNEVVINDIWRNIFPETSDIPLYYSRQHMTYHKFDGVEIFPNIDDLYSGFDLKNYKSVKKDISTVSDLDSSILIDDNPYWVMKSQYRNFLQAPANDFVHFLNLLEKTPNRQGHFRLKEFIHIDDLNNKNLSFYKLLYIAGLLEFAEQHPNGLVSGLEYLQYGNSHLGKHLELQNDITIYRRGYKALTEFTQHGSLPTYIPKIENLFK